MRAAHLIWLLGSVVASVGLLLPFAHPFREDYSGRSIETYLVRDNYGPLRSFAIDLDPEMNPVGFRVTAKVDRSRISGPRGSGYRGRLYLDNVAVVTHTFSFMADKEDAKTSVAPLQVFNVQSAGRYQYVVVGSVNENQLVRSLEVNARRNVKLLSWWDTLLWTACLMVGGWLITVLGEKPPFIQRYEDEARARQLD